MLNRVIMKAWRGSAPAQINVPRDFWTQVIDVDLPQMVRVRASLGRSRTPLPRPRRLLSEAKFPVILNGAGVVLGGAIDASKALAERLTAPVCCNYQHNDAFPGSHPLSRGARWAITAPRPAMELISKADVVLALGTRLNPFSTLPGYGIDYWPKDAKIIQVDINADRIGLTKPVSVGIEGDAKQGGRERSLANCPPPQVTTGGQTAKRPDRRDQDRAGRSNFQPRWTTRTTIPARPGTSAPGTAHPDRMSPAHGLARDPGGSAEGRDHLVGHRQQLRHRQRLSDALSRAANILRPACSARAVMAFRRSSGAKIGCPDLPVVGFAGDGAFGISMNGDERRAVAMTGRAITMVVFRNYQWGAEKRNTTLWYRGQLRGHGTGS